FGIAPGIRLAGHRIAPCRRRDHRGRLGNHNRPHSGVAREMHGTKTPLIGSESRRELHQYNTIRYYSRVTQHRALETSHRPGAGKWLQERRHALAALRHSLRSVELSWSWLRLLTFLVMAGGWYPLARQPIAAACLELAAGVAFTLSVG